MFTRRLCNSERGPIPLRYELSVGGAEACRAALYVDDVLLAQALSRQWVAPVL
jgi:hypothetical protein